MHRIYLEGRFLGRPEDINLFPEQEQQELCYKGVMDSDPEVHMRVARDFLRFQLGINADDRFTLSLARAMLHYAVHQLFLEPGEALSKIGKISSIPAIIIQGTEDKVCLPGQALLLHQNLEQ